MLTDNQLTRLLHIIPHNQTYHSAITGLIIHHSDKPFSYENIIQEPSICIVIRGEREIQLGEQVFVFGDEQFMFCPVDVPMCGNIRHATADEPFVMLSMKIDRQAVHQILLNHTVEFAPSSQPADSFGQWQLDNALKNAFERLLLLHETPNDIPFLAPLIQQEIYYRLLIDEHGNKLKRMVSINSNTQKIAKATKYLQSHYRETVSVDSLAKLCGMSVSGFHHHFKQITTLSPLQYQKSLRLMQAKKLIIKENLPITQVCHQVGYESPSQFSREYKRYFGVCPSQEIT